MKKSLKSGNRAFKTIAYIVCIFLALLSIMPFVIMVVNSTRSTTQIQQHAISLIPSTYLLNNFRIFEGMTFNPSVGFVNSLIISVGAMLIAVVLALIGVAVACVEVTGIGMRLGTFLVSLSMNSLFILLILTAFTAILLGIGLPSPAAYIICATILSPALVKMGVPLLVAHLFPLYYALFSHLTPPVGIGLMVACKMADSDYLKSAVEAMKAAFPSFFLPFIFVYAPGILLLGGDTMTNVLHTVASILFFLAMAVTMNRWCVGKASLSVYLLAFASFLCSGFYLYLPSHPIAMLMGGAALFIVCVALNVVQTRKTAAA